MYLSSQTLVLVSGLRMLQKLTVSAPIQLFSNHAQRVSIDPDAIVSDPTCPLFTIHTNINVKGVSIQGILQ